MKSFRYEKGIYKCPHAAADTTITYFKNRIWDFAGGATEKNLSADAGDTDLIPGLGRLDPHALEQLSLRTTTSEPAL